MRATFVSVLFGSFIFATIACEGPKPSDDACTAPGGSCVTNFNQCGEVLPYPCSQGGVCCRLLAGDASAD